MRQALFFQTAEVTGELRPTRCFLDRVQITRPVRVALLLGLLALLNGFDLGFTLLADRYGRLMELNPVAACVVADDHWLPLAAYKLALVTFGMGVLWRLRGRVLAEWAAWGLVMAYVGVLWRWQWFLSLLSSWQPSASLPRI